MKKFFLTGLCLLSLMGVSAQANYSPTVKAEKLDRGVVAVKTDNGVFISWRSLIDDAKGLSFDVYRGDTKINDAPLTSKTNFTDPDGSAGQTYTVKAILDNQVVETSKPAEVWATPYMKVHLDRPKGGQSPAGGSQQQRDYVYTPDDVSVGDVDGDGEYELIVKWFPTNQADNGSQFRYTGNTILDCYKLDGTKLWRIDLGQNIRSGNHYTQFLVYDFDGDGKAELICKTAPGTIDGQGKAVLMGNDKVTDDYRDNSSSKTPGVVKSGPEYLTVFNGETGAEINTIAYNPPRTIQAQSSSGWGDGNGNRSERYLACAAYLDGQKPSAVFVRGYYTYAYVWAVDFDGSKLKEKWLYSSPKSKELYGQGTHSISVADVDADGCDEIIFGSAALDHNGKFMYSTGGGHGDALHVAAMLPDREGLQVMMPHEETSSKYDISIRDAKTGEVLYYEPQTGGDVGRGLAANVSAKYPGYEWWSSTGKVWGGQAIVSGAKRPDVNFRVYWDGDLLDELFDGKYDSSSNKSYPVITKPNDALSQVATLFNFSQYSNAASCNTTKATPNLQADLFGDWREEIILHDGSTESDLLIFTTTIPSSYKIPSLMQDRQYRMAVAWQNCAYNQPPHLSFSPEAYYDTKGSIVINKGTLNQILYLGDEIQPIVFTVKRAKGVVASNLPDGLTLEFDENTLEGSLTGKIPAVGEYKFTLSTTGAEDGENGQVEANIVVRQNASVQLIAYYPFDKVGDTTPNAIGSQYASQYKPGGGAEEVEGRVGNALKLNGKSVYEQQTYDLLDVAGDSFTVEFWMNSTSAADCYLLMKGYTQAGGSSNGNWFGVEHKNSDTFRFSVDDDVIKSEVGISDASTRVFDGQWHHIVFVRDIPAKTLMLYIDGELTATNEDGTGAITPTDEALFIGGVNRYEQKYNGLLDELALYRGALSASKVKEHYEAKQADYVAYLPMDDVVDNTTPNLVYGEASADSDNYLLPVDGKKAGAIELDGTFCLTQPMYDNINMGEKSFTVEAWVKTSDDDGYVFCIGSHNTTNVAGGTGNWIGLEVKDGTTFAIDDDVTKTDIKGAAINDGEWHHVACVRDYAAKTITLYIDGEEAASKSAVGTNGINCSDSEMLYIGGDDEAGRYLSGRFDEFVIYPRALSADEVNEHYNLYRLTDIEEILENAGPARFTVVNAFSGIVMYSAVGENRYDIIDSLPKGIYVLVVEDGTTVKNYKFIKR